ncbi:MAG TPA: acyl-CoA thioesterase domain-containing protein [Acidimicrobiales bacterium]|nr:acyl-CoA thioesterase domain-containing protein [Acidimicrobiales bacterium]
MPASLLQLIAVEPTGGDVFSGGTPDDWPGGRVFGGLVAAQALGAAVATVDPVHRPHSLHAYFLRPGRPGTPISYRVDRIRDGRSFTTRQVVASQEGEAIFSLSSSFHRDEEGHEYQLPKAADAPDPEGLDEGPFGRMTALRHIDLRDVGPTEPEADGTYRSTRRVWMRCAGELPDDPATHACVITFMSDMGVVMAARPPRDSVTWEAMMGASLDHAVWFHRPVRADEWLFYDLHAVSNHNARGLVRGLMHTRSGVLGASVDQEALIRPLRGSGPRSWAGGPELR